MSSSYNYTYWKIQYWYQKPSHNLNNTFTLNREKQGVWWLFLAAGVAGVCDTRGRFYAGHTVVHICPIDGSAVQSVISPDLWAEPNITITANYDLYKNVHLLFTRIFWNMIKIFLINSKSYSWWRPTAHRTLFYTSRRMTLASQTFVLRTRITSAK